MKSILSAVIALGTAVNLLAHDTWIASDRFHLSRPGVVKISLTSGMAFPGLDTAIKPDRIAVASVRTARGVTELKSISPAAQALELRVRLTAPGVAVFWVTLNQRPIELQPDDVRHYLEEIGAPPAIRATWQQTEPLRWRERYVKHAKTFVRVGSSPGERHWADPVGMALELVPEQDPTQAEPGQRLTFVLLYDGNPLSDQAVYVVREGESEALKRTTDRSGRLSFVIPRSGKYMVRSTVLRESNEPEADWDSDFTTLTFSVAAEVSQ